MSQWIGHGRAAGRAGGGLLLAAACALAAAAPALAQADGEPSLDPSGATSGTTYSFYVKGTSKTMEPSHANEPVRPARGSMTVYQTAGSGEFSADVTIDADGDGSEDGVLTCEGVVGQDRFGMHCEGLDDDLEPINVMLVGEAMRSPASGKVSLKKTMGIGFTDDRSITVVFQAVQHWPAGPRPIPPGGRTGRIPREGLATGRSAALGRGFSGTSGIGPFVS